jgi:phosphate-selective porin OprO/OprP
VTVTELSPKLHKRQAKARTEPGVGEPAMTKKPALMRGAALGVLIALAAGAGAQAQTAMSNAELAAQIRQMQAQLAAMQARLDAQERSQAAAQAQVAAAEAEAAAARAELETARLAAAAPPPAPVPAAPAPQPSYTVAFDGGPRISGGGSSVKIRGRLLLDAVWQHIDRPGGVGGARVSQIRGRQAFLGVEGAIGPNWFYKVEGGAVNGGAWSWDDASIEYRHDPRNSVIVGNQKAVGLETFTSTRTTSFLDRGPMDAMIDGGFHLGAYYWRTGTNYSFNAGVFGHTLNSPDVAPAAGSSGYHERVSASARATFAPVNTATTTVHLGAWGRLRKRGDDTALVYTAAYNSPLRVQSPVTTGAVGDHDLTLGLEGAWVRNNLSLQGEVTNIRVARAAGEPFDLRAGYAFVSFFPTGERRAYGVRGEFGRTRVLNPLSDKGFGALELLARYDFADFTDAAGPAGTPLAAAGTYRAVTLGANWYPISYVRFMANYTRGKYDNLGLANDADVDLFQLRGQVDW